MNQIGKLERFARLGDSARDDFLAQKKAYEDFTKRSIQSDVFRQLAANNNSCRHVLRFFLNLGMFVGWMAAEHVLWIKSPFVAILLYPVYLFFQALTISGLMIHAHELSHHHIKVRWLNDCVGIVSGILSFVNFYSFQFAHRLHHVNIGNLDRPEAGAPVSPRGQQRIRKFDQGKKIGAWLAETSPFLWLFFAWPVFIYYGDYSSWILPFQKRGRTDPKSLLVFVLFVGINILFALLSPGLYLALYLPALLLGGNRILAVTYLHHAHEESVFFDETLHNIFSVVMANSDRDYGRLVNFFMMNNGYHVAHHMNPEIAYYDLKRASDYLRATIPAGLTYHYFANSRLYRDLGRGLYDQRLTADHEIFKIEYKSAQI